MRPVDTINLKPTDYGCAGCGEVFAGGLSLFDQHQAISYDKRPAVTCSSPQELGLVLDYRGVWRTQAGYTRAELLADRMRALHQARQGGLI